MRAANEGGEGLRDDMERGRAELRSLGASTAEITAELRELARLELELAKAEVAENRSRLTSGVIFGAVAAMFGFWILGFLGVALMLAVAEYWPSWAGALVTALVWAVIAATAGLLAWRRFKRFSPTPQKTIASLKEDVVWARRLMKQRPASASSGR